MGTVCTRSAHQVVYPIDSQSTPQIMDCDKPVDSSKQNGQVASAVVRRNQFGDLEDCRMTIEKWTERWKKGQIRFHMKQVHPQLKKHLTVLTAGKKAQTIFLPLCGKSLDMHWLAQQGHLVIGCEAVTLACEQLFKENYIPFTTEPLKSPPGTVFKSTDPSLAVTIYCCDFFQLTKDVVGEIDCIWDRGSLAAIDREDRNRYSGVLLNLLSPQTRYVANVFIMDHDVFTGPPHALPSEEMNSLFGAKCNIETIDEVDCMSDWQREWGVTYFISNDYFITLKPK